MSFIKQNNKIVIIDNYDSFTYNLVHLVEGIINEEVTVLLNDKFEISTLESFSHIIISPGPGLPQNAGKTLEVLKTYSTTKSILGVCLGQQAIGQVFGAELMNLTKVFHGVASTIKILKQDKLFTSFPEKIIVGRYHSWVINKNNLPEYLEILAVDEEGNIMAIQHKYLKVFGVQFHPESIMTEHGKLLIENWLKA